MLCTNNKNILTIVCRHDKFVLSIDNSEVVIRVKVKTEDLQKLANQNNWSIPELANQLGVEYSYLTRVLSGEKNGGAKIFAGLYKICKEKELNIEDYIFLNIPLSADNKKIESTA